MRPIAANAALRPFQMRSRCAWSCAISTVCAPHARQMASTAAKSSSTSEAGPSSSTISTASVFGEFGWTAASADSDMPAKTMLGAVQPPGFLRVFPADGADDLARRIGRVVAPERRDALRDLEVRHARFDHGAQIRDVDLENPVHAREADENAVL